MQLKAGSAEIPPAALGVHTPEGEEYRMPSLVNAQRATASMLRELDMSILVGLVDLRDVILESWPSLPSLHLRSLHYASVRAHQTSFPYGPPMLLR